MDVEVAVDAADDLAMGNVYLTVTGTSAESGDASTPFQRGSSPAR